MAELAEQFGVHPTPDYGLEAATAGPSRGRLWLLQAPTAAPDLKPSREDRAAQAGECFEKARSPRQAC